MDLVLLLEGAGVVPWPGNQQRRHPVSSLILPLSLNGDRKAPPPPPVSSNPDPQWFEPDPGVRENARVSVAGKPQEDSGLPRVEKLQGIDPKVQPSESGTVEELR